MSLFITVFLCSGVVDKKDYREALQCCIFTMLDVWRENFSIDAGTKANEWFDFVASSWVWHKLLVF